MSRQLFTEDPIGRTRKYAQLAVVPNIWAIMCVRVRTQASLGQYLFNGTVY